VGPLVDVRGRIAIYADPAFQSSAGIERYTWELIRAACRSDFADRLVLLTTKADWAAALQRACQEVVGAAEGRPSVIRMGIPARALRYTWSFAAFPPVERLVGTDLALAHTPSHIRIPTRHCPQVVTIHDILFTKLPSLLSRRQRLVLTRQLEAMAVTRSAFLIAISASTKRDLMELFGIPADRIAVIPQGVDHEVFWPRTDATQLARTRAKYGIPGRFVLYVGSLYSRKLGKLLEAFRLVTRHPDGRNCTLVLAGGRESTSAGATSPARRIRELGLAGTVVLTGVVPTQDVTILMSAADVFAYVSFYEGFGLSPLEAMACGAPVVTSSTSSLPEVVGDAGLLVNPQDETEIARAILHVLSDSSVRERMQLLSLEQARRFSWQRTVRETFEVYRTVASY
jgi:glycosyltransferase involved in cell wall biosynthesis